MEILLASICGDNDVITKHGDQDAHKIRRKMKIREPQNNYIPIYKYKLGDFFALIKRGKRAIFRPHQSADEVKKYVSKKVWNSYFKFCFERDPYERFISLYFHVKKRRNLDRDIDEFILKRIKDRGSHSSFYKKNNIVLVDHIYKYEKLNDAMADLSIRFNLEKKLDISTIRTKADSRLDRRHPEEVFHSETIQRINESQQDIFNLLGYDMIRTIHKKSREKILTGDL